MYNVRKQASNLMRKIESKEIKEKMNERDKRKEKKHEKPKFLMKPSVK